MLALLHGEEKDADVLTGVVRGSERDPYRCVIRLRMDRQGFDLDSNCSCPVGLHCKHVAAVLMMATDTPHEFCPGGKAASQPSGRIGRRLAETPRRTTPSRDELGNWPPCQPLVPVADTERQFGILLRSAQHGAPPELLVNLVWLRPAHTKAGAAKAGQLVDPQPLQLHHRHGPVPTPPGGWPPRVGSR